MKFCKDCTYYTQHKDARILAPLCTRPKKPKYNIVTGEDLNYPTYCTTERDGDWLINFVSGFCGDGARFFKAKE